MNEKITPIRTERSHDRKKQFRIFRDYDGTGTMKEAFENAIERQVVERFHEKQEKRAG